MYHILEKKIDFTLDEPICMNYMSSGKCQNIGIYIFKQCLFLRFLLHILVGLFAYEGGG